MKRVERFVFGMIFTMLSIILCSLNIHVTNHEEHVLMRVFDHNKDGRISMEEFYNTLAQEY